MSTPIINNNNFKVQSLPTSSATTPTGATSSSSVTGTSLADTKNQFLQLLITQMQNQDPLSPMDNSQMTSQIAQLNTVQGINQLNATVSSLQAQLQASQGLQATSFIGRSVLAPGSSTTLTNGSATLGVNLNTSTDATLFQITNANGNVVRTMNVGAGVTGANQFSWDGKDDNGNQLADGQYSFAVKASLNGTTVQASPLAFGLVNSVSMGSTGVKLNTNILGSVNVADVQMVK
jgi:flagellar basal-body rod modification protein FlgD